MPIPNCCKIMEWTTGQRDDSIVVHRPRADSRQGNLTEVHHDVGNAGIKVLALLRIVAISFPAGRKHRTIFNIFNK